LGGLGFWNLLLAWNGAGTTVSVPSGAGEAPVAVLPGIAPEALGAGDFVFA
jgi:hypothetical protein